MKRICSMLCILSMLLSLLTISSFAVGENGLSFGNNYRYQTKNDLPTAPETLAAWIRVPQDLDYTIVLFGNYSGGFNQFVNFEIQSSGTPKINYVGIDGEEHPTSFKNVDVRTGEWLHLAIVHDAAAGEVRCYINGMLEQTISGAVAYAKNNTTVPYLLGGDYRVANYRYFRGEIGDVAIYSTARTATEIQSNITFVDRNDADLIAYYDVDEDSEGKDIADLSLNGNDLMCVTEWIDPEDKTPVAGYDYTFVAIGDTQYMPYQFSNKFHCIYDWILENQDEQNIQYVLGLGDIVHTDSDAEWSIAMQHINRLNGVIPHSHIRGNHDGEFNYNQAFNQSAYTGQFEGFYKSGEPTNSWRTLEVGSHKYLMLTLDYLPSDAVVAWANQVVEAHPDHKVILTTHYYQHRTGVLPSKTQYLWDDLISKHENMFLVLSGHIGYEEDLTTYMQTEGEHGNIVTQILIDSQDVDKQLDGVGLVTLLHFYEDGSKISVESYSTVRDQFYLSYNQLDISLTGEVIDDPSTSEPSTSEPGTNVEDTTTDGETGAQTAPSTEAQNGEEPKTGCASAVSGTVGIMVITVAAVFVSRKKKK